MFKVSNATLFRVPVHGTDSSRWYILRIYEYLIVITMLKQLLLLVLCILSFNFTTITISFCLKRA